MDKINVCVIGAGRAGKFHINNLKKLSLFNLKFLIDTNINKGLNLANEFNIEFNNNLEKILKFEKIEAVIIATTTPTHYKLIKDCLNADKHVFCEKPLGNEEQINECFNLATEKNLKLFIAYQKRLDKNYSDLYNSIKNKKIKTLKFITKDFPLPEIEYLKTSNGIVEDMISHDIDIANWYMNFRLPSKVVAFYHTYLKELKDNNEIQEIEIMMYYDTGEIINFTGSRYANYGYDQRVEVFGDFGLIQLNNKSQNNLTIMNQNGISNGNIEFSFPERYNDAYLEELRCFYKIIKDDASLIVKREHLLLNKKICNMINKSIKENKIIFS